MTSAGNHAADDGSLARSTGGAAARGALLIAVALIIGLVLMAFALDDPQTELTSSDTVSADADADSDDATGDADADADADSTAADDASDGSDDPGVEVVDPGEDTTDVPETIPEVEEANAPRPAAEVNVLVANGTGGRGVAGAVADKLKTRGYIAEASNAPSTANAIIYYRVDYAGDARAVAEILGAPPDIIVPAPGDGTIAVAPEAIEDGRLLNANVIVIVGADNAVPPG